MQTTISRIVTLIFQYNTCSCNICTGFYIALTVSYGWALRTLSNDALLCFPYFILPYQLWPDIGTPQEVSSCQTSSQTYSNPALLTSWLPLFIGLITHFQQTNNCQSFVGFLWSGVGKILQTKATCHPWEGSAQGNWTGWVGIGNAGYGWQISWLH